MPSSTSSSDVRWLHAKWGLTWAMTAVIVLLSLCAWETFWRIKGYRPAISDDVRLWISARQSVKPDSVVLVGSSRMHADVHPSYFKEVAGMAPTQLAVNGGMSYLVLEQLAHDVTFKGTVICDLMEVEIATGMTTVWERGVINSYKQRTLAERSDGFLQRLVQKKLALALPQLSLPALAADVVKRQWPAITPHYQISEDRALLVDFSRLDVAKLRNYITSVTVDQGPQITPAEFIARTRRFEVLAEEIERRGGRVIFVKMPITGILWDRLEKAYPKASYWDEFARQTHFATIHFRDYPELQIECADYSHLDMRDAPRFTRALAKILLEKGLIKPE